MTVAYAEELLEHYGHDVQVVAYVSGLDSMFYAERQDSINVFDREIVNVTIECFDCDVVLIELPFKEKESD